MFGDFCDIICEFCGSVICKISFTNMFGTIFFEKLKVLESQWTVFLSVLNNKHCLSLFCHLCTFSLDNVQSAFSQRFLDCKKQPQDFF